MDDDDDAFEAHVASIIAANARLARMLPDGAQLHEARHHRALPAPRPPPSRSVLDEILADLAAQAAAHAAAHCAAGPAAAAPPPPPRAPPLRLDPPLRRPPPERLEHRDGRCCSVCLCAVERTQYSLLAPCFHAFCFGCITKWLRVGAVGSCPECRSIPSALFYSVRSRIDYRVRLLSGDAPALLGALEPAGKG
jgi:hypothetical protein